MDSIANTYRFFVPPSAIDAGTIALADSTLAHQLGRVLRLGVGDTILLLDGLGTAYQVTLTTLNREHIIGEVTAQAPATGEPAVQLTLLAGLIRAERFEWLLQKGTELGVSHFVPVIWERTQPGSRPNQNKLTRWQRIIREAAEQAGRGLLPTLSAPLPFAAACEQIASVERALVLWEGNPEQPAPLLRQILRQLNHPPATIALASGPEGGLTSAELTTAYEHGMISISLGDRILRAETAPIAAAAAVFYEFERL